MKAETALGIVQTVLGRRLSYIEEAVLVQTWSGKLYREIAQAVGYELSYVKDVGAQLWNSLSQVLGKEVSKKNLQVILTQLVQTEGWEQQIASTRLASVSAAAPASNTAPTRSPVYPSRFLSPSSSFYIDRPPIEARAYTELTQPGSLIRIKAPQRMGKTSLVYRLLERGRSLGMKTALLSLQQAERGVLTDLNRFLRWFCRNISRELDLEAQLDTHWDEDLGSKVSCTAFVQERVLKQLDSPLVLVLDDVERIFDYTETAREFLSLLRLWYEEGAETGVWQRLRLVVVHSTELYVPLKLSQSPFNVGLPLYLPEFSLEQVRSLAQRYDLFARNFTMEQLERLFALVGGHPFRMQLAFYWLYQGLPFEQLLREAPTQIGIYDDFLRQQIPLLNQSSSLLSAFRQVVESEEGVALEAIAAYQLESLGLVKLKGNVATISCPLYRQYFRAQFLDDPTWIQLVSAQIERVQRMEQRNRTLQTLVEADAATPGVPANSLSSLLQSQVEGVTQNPIAISLLLCKIDDFRQYQETYGRSASMECLQWISAVIREVVKRPLDLVTRYSEEAFMIVLPMTEAGNAVPIAEAIRERVRALEIPHGATRVVIDPPILTVSLGASTLIPQDPAALTLLLETADQALNQSLQEGGDRVTFRAPVPEK